MLPLMRPSSIRQITKWQPNCYDRVTADLLLLLGFCAIWTALLADAQRAAQPNIVPRCAIPVSMTWLYGDFSGWAICSIRLKRPWLGGLFKPWVSAIAVTGTAEPIS